MATDKSNESPFDLPDDAFDAAFSAEMRQHEVSSNVLRLRLKVLHKMMEEAAICAGVPDMKCAFSREVQDIVLELLTVIKEPDNSHTDIMLAAQVSILVAWRVTLAAVTAAARQLDPASKEGPDDPLYV